MAGTDPTETSITAYVDQAAALLGLVLAAEHRPGVSASAAILHATVVPLLEFRLPAEVEPAAIYEP